MLEGFSESERIAIIGLIASVSVSFLTFLGVVFTNWTTVYVTRINKERENAEKHHGGIILPATQSTKTIQTSVTFRIKPLWIPIVLSVSLFLTIVIFLTLGHTRQRELEKHEFKSPDFYADKGNQYADVGNYPRAEAMYRQALNIDDTDAQIHNKLSVALREQGKLSEALDENITAIAIDATIGDYHFHKGLTLQKMGNRKNANGANNEAMVDYEHAKNAFEEAINRDSKVAQYHFALANVEKDMTRYKDAEVEYRAAIDLESGNAEYHVGYAYVLRYQERLKDALNEVQTAVSLNPNNSEARMLMQSIQLQLERHES